MYIVMALVVVAFAGYWVITAQYLRNSQHDTVKDLKDE